MIHKERCSYYKEMGLIRDGGLLYMGPVLRTGFHLAEGILLALEANNVIRFHEYGVALALVKLRFNTELGGAAFHGNISFLLKGLRNGRNISSSLVTIQRAVRVFVRGGLARRYTALAMGLHPRLGSCSALGCLCPDLLRLVLQDQPIQKEVGGGPSA
jgi:hypothetical protein